MKKALILFLTICSISFVLSSNIKAKADEMPIYYITDNQNYSSLSNYIISNTFYTSNDVHIYNWNLNFYSGFSNNYTLLYGIEDSFVIFELSNGFDDYKINNNIYFVDELCDLFEEMKNNGCYIVFISNTDENKYFNNNDFLDYVDFHIITDVKNVFTINMFYYLELQKGSKPTYVDLFFGNDYINLFGGYYDTMVGLLNHEGFKNQYLIPYINSRYENDISIYGSQSSALVNNNISFNVEIDVDSYYNIVSNSLYPINITYYSSMYDWYCVGSSNPSYLTTTNYLDIVSPLSLNYMFYYDAYNQGAISSYSFDLDATVYIAEPNYTNQTILDMVLNFIINRDNCVLYDNWDGRCEITHIMLDTVSNSWIINFTADENSNFINCWDLYGDSALEYDDGSLL